MIYIHYTGSSHNDGPKLVIFPLLMSSVVDCGLLLFKKNSLD